MPDNRKQQVAAILKSIKQNEGGHLKIFLGAAPGVGKTYAMLCAAKERQQQGKILGNRMGHVFGALAVLVATALAVPLELWVYNKNLILIYVLAVVLTGLKYGSRPAMLASVLAFLSFNFFLTEPRYTFIVARQDELATLVFLFLIALVCGPAASRIRRQFILLREANRYSEAMRLFGQALSVADDTKAVWLTVATELNNALQTECCIVTREEGGAYQTFPKPSSRFIPVDNAAIEWTRKHVAPSGRFTDTLSASVWTVFPICKDEQCIAIALFRFDSSLNSLQPYDRELITAMLRQAADTWRRIQLAGELESARVKTEVEQLRSALLSSVSHDLKSPLSAMMGAAESLQVLEKQLSPLDCQELVETILQESRRLESYIQNLLDMTRLGHGTLKIERDWVSVADIVGSALTRLKRYFPGIKTEYHSTSPPPLLYVHAALVEQALFNILENAAKFSPPEEKIHIRVEQRGNICAIEIEDRGPGIPESVREQIFDRFYVVSEGDQKKQSTGMGLAICRGMIGAHGGSVYALGGSRHFHHKGTGTRFVVELPIDYPAASEHDPKKTSES